MLYLATIFTLLFAVTVSAASTSSFRKLANNSECKFRFQHPNPFFELQPERKGDITLNVGQDGQINNMIVLQDGTPLNKGQGCNSFGVEWLGRDGKFKKVFRGDNGQPEPIDQIFFVTLEQVKRRTLQDNWGNLPQILSGRKIKMDILCNNVERGCLEFTIAPRN